MFRVKNLIKSPLYKYACKTIIPITTVSSLGYSMRNNYSYSQSAQLTIKNTVKSSILSVYLLNPYYILPTILIFSTTPLVLFSPFGFFCLHAGVILVYLSRIKL